MNDRWAEHFRDRFRALEAVMQRPDSGTALSLKIRVTGGCFHREHSPEAYRIIDRQVDSEQLREHHLVFEEHESGPELLAWLAIATVTASLLKELVGFASAIVKARSEGVKNGDSRREPLEIIIRGVADNGEYREKSLLHVAHHETLDEDRFEQQIDQAIKEMFGEPPT